MKTIVDENRMLLEFYRRAARIVGWVLLCGGCVWLLVFVFWILAAVDAAGASRWPGLGRNITYAVAAFSLDFLIPGLLALMAADFIGYTLDTEGRSGCVLRHGVWILYACAVVFVVRAVLTLAGWGPPGPRDPDEAGLLFAGPLLVPLLAKVLVCVGLGHLLGRVLPIIDESKTLV